MAVPARIGEKLGSNAPRIGVARLTRMSFHGIDLAPLWNELLGRVQKQRASMADIMDMSVIAQLLGDKANGLLLQEGALGNERLYYSPCATPTPGLRLLAIAAVTDLGGNTPLEFLLEGSDVELCTLYIKRGEALPACLPPHDIAMVVAPAAEDTAALLSAIAPLLQAWDGPVLNKPENIANLSRDRLHRLLRPIPSLLIPPTARISREQLSEIGNSSGDLQHCLGEDARFPIIVRPLDSHAGRGLAKLDRESEVPGYLQQQSETGFFISPFVDYSGSEGLFRKYRIVFIDGRPFACHMAISEQWKIWYLNANMEHSAAKRAEEAHFMTTFETAFAVRHAAALSEIARRIGLDYFGIDCAETPDGALLLFEADNALIVHNMDPPEVFPYKPPQMQKLFSAFLAMLHRRASNSQADAA